MKNLKVYYELINEQILEEQNNQELQQKNMKDQCDKNLKGNKDINVILSRRQLILFKLKEYKYLNDLKVKAFVSLYKNYIEEKNNNKKLHLVEKLIKQNKIKKIIRALKDQCLFQKNKEYEIKIQNKSKMELMKLNNDLNNQKQDLLLLISQARERLKHENRKKIQVNEDDPSYQPPQKRQLPAIESNPSVAETLNAMFPPRECAVCCNNVLTIFH